MGGTQDGVERWGQKTGWLAELSALTFLLLLLLLPVEAGMRGDGVVADILISCLRQAGCESFHLAAHEARVCCSHGGRPIRRCWCSGVCSVGGMRCGVPFCPYSTVITLLNCLCIQNLKKSERWVLHLPSVANRQTHVHPHARMHVHSDSCFCRSKIAVSGHGHDMVWALRPLARAKIRHQHTGMVCTLNDKRPKKGGGEGKEDWHVSCFSR